MYLHNADRQFCSTFFYKEESDEYDENLMLMKGETRHFR
jgi:hypothetical protein